MTLRISDSRHKWHLALQRSAIILSAIMLSVAFYLLLCLMSLCWVLLGWVSWRPFWQHQGCITKKSASATLCDNKLACLSISETFTTDEHLVFAGKGGAHLGILRRLWAFHVNIRLGRKWLTVTVTNTPTYYCPEWYDICPTYLNFPDTNGRESTVNRLLDGSIYPG